MKGFMKRALALIMAALMAASFAAFPFSATAAEKNDSKDYADGEVIVVLDKSASGNYLKANKAAAVYGKSIKLKNTFSFTGKNKKNKINVAVLKSSTYSTKQLIRRLKKNSAIKYAFPNTKKKALGITNDTYADFQWALNNTGQNGGKADSDTNPQGLWDKAKTSKKEQIVAVVDTGLDLTSAEFKGIVWENKHGSRLLGKNGYDFVNEDADPQDDNGHGTHCAGIIAAAADNENGISGINKASTKIMPVKWLDEDGSGYTEAVLAAYDYISRAIDLGENVVAISNSWGGEGDLDEIKAFEEIFDKFGEKGVVSLVAAGNDGMDISEGVTEFDSIFGPMELDEPVYTVPACCNSEYQLTVAATNEYDELAGFSNYSKTLVDVAAPGADILSTVSYDCFNPTIYSSEKRAQLVAKMQDFDGEFNASSFGYPKAIAISHDQSKEMFAVDFSTNISVTQSDKHFGNAGKAVTVTTQDEIEQPEDEDEDEPALLYAFEIPYTITDAAKDKKYSVSFMISGNLPSFCLAVDVPASTDIGENLESIMDYQVAFGGMSGGVFWDHMTYEVDPSQDKATERKIVFVAESYMKGTEFTIDDLAISTQGVDSSEFERYDFYCGTSMATPYVAGAVALVWNAYPDASVRDVINMVKNTGRKAEALKDKVESGRVISLENTDKTPPMIFKAKYNDKGAVVIEGSFKDITSLKVNGTEVKPSSSKQNEIVVPDKNYNTKRITVEAVNAYGTDSYTGLLSKKTLIEKSDEVEGEPSSTVGGFMLPAGDKAYYINGYNAIGVIAYDAEMKLYTFDEMSVPQLDYTKLFDYDEEDGIEVNVTSAVYSNGKLYFTALRPITTSATGTVIGYDNAFGAINLTTGETVKLGEIPEEAMFGSSLAAYNGSIYLAGGCTETEYSNAFYQYNATKKAFVKNAASLPEGRAYTRFLQYENKLYGVYGAVKSGEMPAIISYDGKKWSASKLKLTTDDYEDYTVDPAVPVKVYDGNLGYGKNGLFLNGIYIYGYGDTYDYDVKNDKLVASAYATKNTLDGTKLIGTTLPGCFIGYERQEEEVDIDDLDFFSLNKKIISGISDDDDFDGIDFDDIEVTPVAYKLNTTTAYAKITGSVKNAKVKASQTNVAYGDTVTVKVTPNAGYVVESISANGKVVAKESNKATVRATASAIKITASLKYVAPAKVKGLKATTKKGKAVLKWKKAKKAQGYQVQQYKNGKWKTVKTIKKAKTTKYTSKKLKKGTKFRVRAYTKYKGTTYYGKWSKVVKVKIK